MFCVEATMPSCIQLDWNRNSYYFFAEIDGFSVDVHGATIGSTASRQRNAETTTWISCFKTGILFIIDQYKIKSWISKILWIHKKMNNIHSKFCGSTKNDQYTVKILWIHKILISFPPKFYGSIKFWSHVHQNFMDP